MMQELEDSTLDLIYRRRVSSFLPGYVILILVMVTGVALPLVKVDVITSSRGMVRPFHEPVEVYAPITGILDSCRLQNNLQVSTGDTLVWIRSDIPKAKMKARAEMMALNRASILDITHILEGEVPKETSRFRQSHRNHLAALSHLQLQEEFLHKEFRVAEQLYRQEVISLYDYEKAESDYLIMTAKVSDLRESYRDMLATELQRLELENSTYHGEIEQIRSTLNDYIITAPLSGTLLHNQGITTGSVIHTGTSLGMISPTGRLVAECYLPPATIQTIGLGTRVKIRIDDPGFNLNTFLETHVDHIDKDVSVIDGNPVYRIRCTLKNPYLRTSEGAFTPLRKGMTFTANFILSRRSLAHLMLEKMDRWVNPSEGAAS